MPKILNYRGAFLLLLISLAAGSWLRLSQLDSRSITHPEMYVPNIPLPEGMSEPVERTTVARILTGTFSSDTHPPGYYLLMFPWTRGLGTSLSTMRLPSAIFGIACIALVFALGWAAGVPWAGAIAAALLALSGYHVFWSQVARMFTLACFLGLLSTFLLVRIARGSRYAGLLTALYVVAVLAGVATHVFFWSLFATQLLWGLGNGIGKRELPGFCRAQLFTLIVGSPLIAFAAYQSANTVADLSGNVLRYLAEFTSFAFALPSTQSGFFPSRVPFYEGIYWVARAGILLIAAILLIQGLRSLWGAKAKTLLLTEEISNPGLWSLAWIGGGLVATLEIAGFVYFSQRLEPGLIRDTIRLTKAFTIVPLILTAAALIVNRQWGKLRLPTLLTRWVAGERALLAMLGVLPFLLLGSVSTLRPLLNQRGLLFASPYLLLVLAAGLMALSAHWRMALVPVLAAIFAGSLISYSTMTVDPGDYGQFAANLQTEIQSGDLVFIRKIWSETPILYYLRADKYHLVGRRFAETCAAQPGAAVWLVLLNEVQPSPEMVLALSGYRPVRNLSYPHAVAIRYERAKIQTAVAVVPKL